MPAVALVLLPSPALGQSDPVTDSPSPAPGSQPAEEQLLRELQAAAAADELESKAVMEADSLIAAEQRAQDPMRALGIGVTGNEMNPSFSVIIDALGAYFTREQRLRQGGHAPTHTGPEMQGVELAISANVDPYFRVDLNHELYHNHLEEAYATTTSLPWNLKLRAGLFKADVGRHNRTHPHTWDFVLAPMPNQFLFGAEGFGAPGAELSVLMPLPWYVEVLGSLQSGEGGSFRTAVDTDPGLSDFVYPVRLLQFFDLSDDWGLQVGANMVQGTSAIAPDAGNRTSAYGADWVAKWRPIGAGETGYRFVRWTAEGWYRVMEVPQDLWRDAGGYTDVVFGLSKQWQTGVRFELWRRLSGDEPTVQNTRMRFGTDMERASCQLTFLPSHFSKVRFQYSGEHVETLGANHIGLIQLEVSAGAHGAHAY